MPVARSQIASAKPKTITQWSYSRYRDWLRCRAYAKFKHVDKLKEPGNKAMDRGGDIHKMAQAYTEAPKVPRKIAPELACFEVEFKDLNRRRATCEAEWAFTREWRPTGWFDEDCWLRVKMDVHYFLAAENSVRVVDHKTGKVAHPESFADQEELYALGALLQYPDAESVNVQFWYLDAGVIGSTARGSQTPIPKSGPTDEQQAAGAVYLRSDEKWLKAKWAKNVKPMMLDTVFRPHPEARKCEYCHFSKAKGGPCKY
jgi:hypothetical protein